MQNQYGEECLSGDEKIAQAALQRLLHAVYRKLQWSEEYLARVSIKYHFENKDNDTPAHLFIEMLSPKIKRDDPIARNQNVALPKKIVDDLTRLLGDDCHVGEGNEYIQINGSFVDASATLKGAILAMEAGESRRSALTEQRRLVGHIDRFRKPLLCLADRRQPTASGNSQAR